MNESKKITVIAPFAFGYTAHIAQALKKNPSVLSSIIYLDSPSFKYKNIFHKILNFLSKTFLNQNLKKVFVQNRIKNNINALGSQDIIFIIRPDMLDDDTLNFLREHTKNFIAYYYDSNRRFPRKVDIIPFFDTIYSYDRDDVSKYNLKFLTNYIFEESYKNDFDYLFFNISTVDYRFHILESLARYFKEKKWSFKMLAYSAGPVVSDVVTILEDQKNIEEVSQLIKKCKIIVEIQRTEQIGLSFRVFEALGHRKKLITTNKDIVNYDFYHPQNILVIKEDNINIPEDFVDSPYVEINQKILDKYKIDTWTAQVFEL